MGGPAATVDASTDDEDNAPKHIGAEGGQQGYDFQDMVSVVVALALIRKATWPRLRQVQVRQNAPRSQVDDLHIWGGVPRRHLQIKSTKALTWEKKLRKEFHHDRLVYPEAQLELWVASQEKCKTMAENRKAHGLPFVHMRWLSLELQRQPFAEPNTANKLSVLCRAESPVKFHEAMWHSIEGTWRRTLKRRGNLLELLSMASRAAGYIIKFPAGKSEKVERLAKVLQLAVPAFSFSADGEILFYRYRDLVSVTPFYLDEPAIIDDLLERPPESEAEFLKRMGGKNNAR
ncbi:hypothetical protein GOB27_19500 [Sinorhizobium meliloti]|nr:hypothetical protein [Sinorhizobium meliloti]